MVKGKNSSVFSSDRISQLNSFHKRNFLNKPINFEKMKNNIFDIFFLLKFRGKQQKLG